MKEEKNKIIIALILFVIALLIKFPNIWINNIIYIISYLIVGTEILKEAVENILKGKIFDENFLMSIATLGAFAIGEFPEAVAVMLFYQIGESLQDYAVDKSKKSISDLMNIRPDYANVLKGNEVQKVSPESIKVGDIIVVMPGEKVPLDGIIIEGKSMVDTSSLTGESVPRSVNVKDEILSGFINQTGLLKIKVTKLFGESTVSKILDLVENATNKKSKSENFITKFAKYYTPTVVIIAIILAIVPPMILQTGEFTTWLYRALAFLVVSCPCALVISIPLGFFGGIGGASKIGVLIKGSNYLEALSKTETVVFDKTGTLTKGVFEVQKIDAVNMPYQDLIKIAAHAESYCNHPISNSIKRAYGKEIDKTLVTDTHEIAGKGVEAKFDGKTILIGNEKLMQEQNVNFTKCEEAGTIVYVAINKEYAGYIVISDEIKEDAEKTIMDLKKSGIRQTVMLTGDKKEIGEKVAEKLNIDRVYTDLLPDAKVEKVEALLKEKTKNGKLAFAGDGINDAPVLAISDIGIAMGGLGSDAAIEAADIVIMTDEPSKISNVIKLSKKTMRIVMENIIFAIFIKVLVLILSAIGLATMWEAVFADVGVTVIATINSLRVLNVRKYY